MVRSHRGFTLLELMIVVVVIGILAAIAIPSYRAYVIRGNRAAAESQMMAIADLEQQYLLANRVYADEATLVYALPSDVAANYSYTITGDLTGTGGTAIPTFSINFTAIGNQVSDGNLQLASDGTKTPAGKW